MTHLEMFFNEDFTGILFSGIEWVYLGDLQDECILEVNGVVKWVMRRKLFISFLQKYISKVHTKFWNGCVLGFLCLGDLG